ncbi:hypothetical protein BARVI_08440 [Barnesiella viscericola DSM 18177]|uniref:Uncharacterized protein n=1 Tax=Barnesiella viscericola DSM 18177 TaxID=880074 RepID=W0EXP4_9BACT|nr:hypothetical protein BARVI_08440 [Barnesiella viscericola DSM 18177]
MWHIAFGETGPSPRAQRNIQKGVRVGIGATLRPMGESGEKNDGEGRMWGKDV